MLKSIKKTVLKTNKLDRILALLLFGLTFAIYTHNLSPGVYGGDSGDLISAAITKGVPHPSGYPLYTMLGILFLKLPFAMTPAWKVGLVSSFFSSLGVVVMYYIANELTKNKYLSAVASLTLAFTYPFWLYAEVAEVFALNNFFLLTLVYATIKYLKSKDNKYLFVTSYLAGLALTNNLTIMLIFPAIGISIFLANKKVLLDFKLIIKSIGFFLLGLVPYLYIPISAKSNNYYSWGAAYNLKNFLAVVLRKEYGWAITSSGFVEGKVEHLFQNYFIYWSEYVNTLIPILSLLGFAYLLFKKRYLILLFITTSFLFLGPFFIIYSRSFIKSLIIIAVKEKFYVAGIVVLITLIPLGIQALIDTIKVMPIRRNLKSFLTTTFYAAFIFIPLVSLFTNFERLNFKNVYIGDNFGLDIINTLPKNSIAMLTGDTKVFNSYYMQYAHGIRNDVYIPGRPDSFRRLLERTGMTKEEVENYISVRGGTIDRETYVEVMLNIVKDNNVYTDHAVENMEMVHEDYGKIIFVPWGLTNKVFFESTFDLTKDEYVSQMEIITSQYHDPLHNNNSQSTYYSINNSDIQQLYARSYFAIANFIGSYYSDSKAALPFLLKSIELDPFDQASS